MEKKQPLIERFQKLAGIKPLYELDKKTTVGDEMEKWLATEPFEQDDEDLRLEPEDNEYEDGTEFYDEEDYDFDPEDGVVDEVELDDLDFKTLKAAFPKFYQKVKFTRPQTGEPVYSDAISFPNLDDSMMEIGDSSALEDWKNKVSRRFGNVEIEFNDQAKNWFDRVFIHSDDFNDERDSFIRNKMSALNR